MHTLGWAAQSWAQALQLSELLRVSAGKLRAHTTACASGSCPAPAQGRSCGRSQAQHMRRNPGCTRPEAPLEPSRGQQPPSYGPTGAEAAGFHLRRAGLWAPPPRGTPQSSRLRELRGLSGSVLTLKGQGKRKQGMSSRMTLLSLLLHPQSPKQSLHIVHTQ